MISKNYLKITTAILTINLLLSCVNPKKIFNSGQIRLDSNIFDSTQKKYINYDYTSERKIWFKDSVIVQPALEVNFVEFKGKEEVTLIKVHYSYLDLRSKTVYDYSSFSDTAKILRAYILHDTANLPGCWSFWKENFRIFSDNPKELADTVINNITYKRIIKKFAEKNITIGYLRCDKKGMIFHLDKNYDLKHDCPIVRFEYIYPGQSWIKNEILFVSDKLTDKEAKIFKKWEQYAKENPVK